MTGPLAADPVAAVALFAGFGVVVGLIFGFFGMGSFLVTPTLLVLGYDSTVAVGSGLAFVFGTAVIATLEHRDLGRIDLRLGLLTILGTTVGIEVGKQGLLALRAMGLADSVVGAGYVLLLGAVGATVLLDARGEDDDAAEESGSGTGPDWPRGVGPILRMPPRFAMPDGGRVSVWSVLVVAFVAGVPAGLLGIGGGFLRVPALTELLGAGLSVAVGTNVFSMTVAGAIGSFSWAQAGGVDLAVVGPLLVGSALGARVGSRATAVVDVDSSRVYFGALLVLAAVALAIRHVGTWLSMPSLRVAGVVLLVGAATVVAALIVVSAIRSLGATTDGSHAPLD